MNDILRKIYYWTYPWAMIQPGGGERQLFAYKSHLEKMGIYPKLFDMWDPGHVEDSIFHVFSVMPGVIETVSYMKNRGNKIVISPNLWVTTATVSDYPFDYIWNCFELADVILVNSIAEMATLSSVYSFPESKFRIVFNAAEPVFAARISPEIFRRKYSVEYPYILNIANIEPRKNQFKLIQSLAKAIPNFNLVTIGHIRDTDYYNQCRQLAGDKFRVIEPLPYASDLVRSAIAGCELFAMPSKLETPSIAAIEAAASGAKILLTEVGSTREYFQDSVTYVNPDCLDSICGGIISGMSSNQESSTWAAQHKFLWPKVIPALAEVYREISKDIV